MDISKENKLSELIMRHLQGDNSPQELQQLKKMLHDDAEAVELYVEYMMQFSALSQPGNIIIEDLSEELSLSLLDTSLWMALSKYEMEAPEIDLPKEQPQQELIQKVVYPPKEKRAMSKWGLSLLIVSAAAVVFLLLFIRFVPPKSGMEVATLEDSIGAQWGLVSDDMSNGKRFLSSEDMWVLKQGIVKIEFDEGASVVLEGPLEFSIPSSKELKIDSGRLYATVPPEAVGFTLDTGNSKIVDLGTEFAVQKNRYGSTELHVIKGKTKLLAFAADGKKEVFLQKQGNAVAVKDQGGEPSVSKIPLKKNYYVKDFSSEKGLIWKGDVEIDLHDIRGTSVDYLSDLYKVTPMSPVNNPLAWYNFEQSGFKASNQMDTDGTTDLQLTDQNLWVEDGKYGRCVKFDGHHIASMANANEIFSRLSDQITVCFWYYSPPIQPIPHCVFKGWISSEEHTLMGLMPWNNGVIVWTSYDEPEGFLRYNSTDPNEFNGHWNHVAMTKNTLTGQANIYLNGIFVAKTKTKAGAGWPGASTKPIDRTQEFAIGGWPHAGTDHEWNFQGKVDEFKIYDYALSQEEVAYEAGIRKSFAQGLPLEQ
jgi:hypothetical protein